MFLVMGEFLCFWNNRAVPSNLWHDCRLCWILRGSRTARSLPLLKSLPKLVKVSTAFHLRVNVSDMLFLPYPPFPPQPVLSQAMVGFLRENTDEK